MTNEIRKTLDSIRTLALRDLETASDEEIRAELAAEGADPDQLAASIAMSLDNVLAASLRQHAAAAKMIMQVRTPAKKSLRPTLDRIKERIEQAALDWRDGRFPIVPGDEEEFIPLPEGTPRIRD